MNRIIFLEYKQPKCAKCNEEAQQQIFIDEQNKQDQKLYSCNECAIEILKDYLKRIV